MDNQRTFADGILKKELTKIFLVGSVFYIAVYIGVTVLLNSIRATASLWLVWPLIIIQLIIYILFFVRGYKHIINKGLNTNIALVIALILALLGRVNDWEILAIPLLVITAVLIPWSNKELTPERS